MIVLCVSAVLFYAGVFESTAKPLFEGLDSSAVKPVPEQAVLYSDGVLVLTVMNTRPYSVQITYVDVAPIADRDDVLRTPIDVLIKHGELVVINVNASNVQQSVSNALIPLAPNVFAKKNKVKNKEKNKVNFHICFQEEHSSSGKIKTNVHCGVFKNIMVGAEPFLGFKECVSAELCYDDSDCCGCELCSLFGEDSDEGGVCNDFCAVDETCESTLQNPDGECVPVDEDDPDDDGNV